MLAHEKKIIGKIQEHISDLEYVVEEEKKKDGWELKVRDKNSDWDWTLEQSTLYRAYSELFKVIVVREAWADHIEFDRPTRGELLSYVRACKVLTEGHGIGKHIDEMLARNDKK